MAAVFFRGLWYTLFRKPHGTPRVLGGDTAPAWRVCGKRKRGFMNIEIILAVILQLFSLVEALARIIGFNLPLFTFGG